MTTDKNWFTVDRKGLAEIVERRGGLAWLIQELVSNGWDEAGVTRVDVILEPHEGSPFVDVIVRDDAPDGFKDLSHAWTLFAKSGKRGDAEKRGRFNLGEKLVLAFCKEASIQTTTGTVIFDQRGRTVSSKSKRESGSEFVGTVRMTRAQLDQALVDLKRLIPPANITTTINGQKLDDRQPIKAWHEHLWTELPDEETGALARRVRHAEVRVFKPRPGESPMLYELGIPVVPLDGDPYHVDVRQKIPLNLERDNVTPSYLADLRASVLSHIHDVVRAEALTGAWATDAISNWRTPKEAVEAALTARFGEQRVIADPSDREAENRCKGKGYTVVHGGSLPKEAWERVRELGLMQPAGQVSPTPRHFDDDAPKCKLLEFDELSTLVKMGVRRYRAICRVLLGYEVTLLFADEPAWPVLATWFPGKRRMLLNVTKLGESHFWDDAAIYALAIHEIAHEVEGNHLDEKYHDELCRLAGKLACACTRREIDSQMEAYRDEEAAAQASRAS